MIKAISKRAVLRQIGTTLLIVLATLLVIDLALIAFGLFPPSYRYGDPTLGWKTVPPRTLPLDACNEMSTGTRIEYHRNELGIRTSLTREEIGADPDRFLIAAVGDSQSNLCAPNGETHQGVLESELTNMGVNTLVLSNGVGRYSPLQAYLLFKERLLPFEPDVLLLNLYTGNDFIDMLRVDDRPHFVADGDGYEIVPPVWYLLYDPGVERYSRVMFVYRSLLERVGIRNLYLRFRFLSNAAGQTGQGTTTVVRYVNDLRKSYESSVGYSGAFAAQMLNQQLFLHHFPGSAEEALRRTRALMRLIREENPDLMLIMSPIPSYQLAGEEPVDAAFLETLDRLPLTHSGNIEEEERLYNALAELSAEEGWLFVDNLQPLREHRGSGRMYNDFDYHLLPPASRIIGLNQAEVIRRQLEGSAAAEGGRSR